ncbi:MAG: cobalamin-binding protein [Halioglobus sp.]|nr:cobalamin-binding protein [Halioglobus sp.]
MVARTPTRRYAHFAQFMAVLLIALPVQAEIRMRDALEREVVLPGPAQRVVSLAPHITEVVYAAGAGEQLVGAVAYSNYPPEALDVTRVGAYDSISLETIVSLQPDLVLAWRSGNGEEIVRRIESLGINVYVSETRTLEDVAYSLRNVGRLTGNEALAEQAATEFLQELARLRDTYSYETPVSVFYQVWHEPLLTLNGEHLVSDVVRLCGGVNAFKESPALVSRINVESVIGADPDVIVASGMDKARPEWLDEWRRWSSIRAVEHEQLYFVPPDLLQRHTPRIIEGAGQLCAHLATARRYYRQEAAKGQ